MKSKFIIGIPLLFIGVMIIYNYFDSPPVGFKNIRGHYTVSGGPVEGCVLLLQPGAGINVFGYIGGQEAEEADLTGKVVGNDFKMTFSSGGQSSEATLDVSKPTLVGKAPYNNWKWVKTEKC